jgi:cytoskeletal protein CcmA (bactofilin family)
LTTAQGRSGIEGRSLLAARTVIRGTVDAPGLVEITAADLRILSGAVVQGQVTVTTLAVEAGAGIDFDCKMQGTGSSGEG